MKLYARSTIIFWICSSIFYLGACASSSRSPDQATPEKAKTELPLETTAALPAESSSEDLKITLKKDTLSSKANNKKQDPQDFQNVDTLEDTSSENPTGRNRIRGPIDGEKAWGWLKNGNTRFVKGRLRKDGLSRKDLVRTSITQSPHAVVIASSDSRLAPELIFDQKLGEIYTVRIVGPLMNDAVAASVEHAVQNLGANLVVIIGHQDGADTTGLSEKLLQKSNLLQDAVKSGEVLVKDAFYDIKTGVVSWR